MGRWFALGLVLLAAGLFGLGYFLHAEVVQLLWRLLSLFLLGTGLVIFVWMSRLSRAKKTEGPRDPVSDPADPSKP
jgi:hypothetical protein